MSEDSSQRLIRELAAGLEPVEPMLALRVQVAGVLMLWAAMMAMVLLALGPRADVSHQLSADSAYAGVTLGLLLAGIGGAVAAFAASIPGRETARLGALAMGVSGVTVAGLVCLAAPNAGVSTDPAADLACMGYSALLSVPLVGLILYRVVRAWVQEPARVAVIALFGAIAMGALIVHLVCPSGASSHFLAAHLGAAPLGALLGSVPVIFLLRRAID